MSNKKDGGPAFPGSRSTEDRGMTLRDYFAGKALGPLIERSMEVGNYPRGSSNEWARTAYDIADAMLAEREK